MQRIVQIVQKLSLSRDLESVVEIVRHAARELTGSDGATFILRDDDHCHYLDEDAISPLWKGKRFPLQACISGWVMQTGQSAIIEDIYQDSRIPAEAYRPTFVKSLVIVPIRSKKPIGAIGTYWANHRKATSDEVDVLQALADSTSVALENIQLYQSLQTALQQAQTASDELRRQLSLRDEFISIAAHELKTPLTPLMLQIQLIGRMIQAGKFQNHPMEPDLFRFFDISQRQINGFGGLVDALLDISKIRLDRLNIRFEENVDLSHLVSTVIEEHRLISSIEFQTTLTPGIKGYWDKNRLVQVVRNLISNAVRYGKGRPVHVKTFVEKDQAHLIVQDHGIGISPENQDRIFDRFERATSIQSFGGMGLGLYIVRKIVESHGGRIWVESKIDEGSSFIVHFPFSS